MSQSTSSQEQILSVAPFKQKKLTQYWQLWAILIIMMSSGIGYVATTVLFRLPGLPNCSTLLLPLASASMRLYCAQLEAQKKTVKSLLNAINLVQVLPDDHPMKAQIDENVQEWAMDILKLAEGDFQAGKLKEAIAMANSIPVDSQAYKLVEKKIKRWKTIWAQGEAIYAKVDKQLREARWGMAFREVVELTLLDNNYWATTRYEQTINQIQVAVEESKRLDAAFVKLRRGGMENLIAVIAQAETVDSKSYTYTEAQKLIAQAKKEIMDYIQAATDRKKWTEALDIINKIPDNLAVKKDFNDWYKLSTAGVNASDNSLNGLRLAIFNAEQLQPSSPLYKQAQELISYWKLEEQGLSHLTDARRLAESGKIPDLNAAITKASMIVSSNPRYKEARSQISTWTQDIQVIEDRPILDRAQEIAAYRNISSWQAAIAQASLISSNRPLYSQAKQLINQWQDKIEEEEDRPILEQADVLATAGNYTQAVSVVGRITKGRSLYSQARQRMRTWQTEVDSAYNLQQAYRVAQAQTPDAMERAIAIARRIPAGTEVSGESRAMIERWGDKILEMAREAANYSLENGITIAGKVPSGTTAYDTARSQIKIWQEMLRPPEPEPVSPTIDGSSPPQWENPN